MLLLISVGLVAGGRLKFQLFPELDGDFLVARIELPQGTDLERTRQVVARIEEALDEGRRPVPASGSPDGQRRWCSHVATSFGFTRR